MLLTFTNSYIQDNTYPAKRSLSQFLTFSVITFKLAVTLYSSLLVFLSYPF